MVVVIHSTAWSSSDNIPPLPADNHHSSDAVCQRTEGSYSEESSKGHETLPPMDRDIKSVSPLVRHFAYTTYSHSHSSAWPINGKTRCHLQNQTYITHCTIAEKDPAWCKMNEQTEMTVTVSLSRH